jgi:predicted MFS family arabinose efflux permease
LPPEGHIPSSPSSRLPLVIYVLTAGTFLMGTTEFVVAGLLPELATDFDISVAQAGLAITVFAVGMIIGAPSMALLTLRLPRRLTLTLALLVFAVGHVIVALTDSYPVLLAARCLTAFATGAFWAVAAVVAARIVGPAASSRALGIVLGGGMLANVLGVPIGAFAGQLIGWRGPFWALAVLAGLLAVAVARTVPADNTEHATPTIRAEFAGLRSRRLWLTLATCAAVNAGVLSIYSFIAPLLTDRTGLPAWTIPIALVLFGAGALIGSVLGGRAGDRRPFGTPLVTATVSLVASAGLCLFSTMPIPTLILFTLLGLVGLSANPVLVSLAVRYGGDAPTLASAMATSIFNLGTAVGTAITGAALATSLGTFAIPLVGVIFGVIVFLPLVALTALEHRSRQRSTVSSGTG